MFIGVFNIHIKIIPNNEEIKPIKVGRSEITADSAEPKSIDELISYGLSVKGAKKARTPKKQAWMTTIRALRKDLKEMRDEEVIDVTTYRKLYKMAKGGAFRSKSYMRNYARDHDLIKGDD